METRTLLIGIQNLVNDRREHTVEVLSGTGSVECDRMLSEACISEKEDPNERQPQTIVSHDCPYMTSRCYLTELQSRFLSAACSLKSKKTIDIKSLSEQYQLFSGWHEV